jgi:hypothetical protein
MRCAMLVEEHAAFRQTLAYLLECHLEVALVEEASTVAEARAITLENLGVIDVVVSELSLPDGDALRASWLPCARRRLMCRCWCSPSGGIGLRTSGRSSSAPHG